MTKKYPEDMSLLMDSVSARTCRHLRLMKALFEIDDPELEQAFAVILERLAGSGSLISSNGPSPRSKLNGRPPRKPQAS
jgi:hypothetical protein